MKRKRPWAVVATSVLIFSPFLGQGTAYAGTTHQMRVTHVEINNKVLSSPSAFTYHNTTYIPLFYVQQLLRSLPITNQWTSPTWQIKAIYERPGTQVLNAKTGPVNVYVNGKVVAEHVDEQIAVDPASHKDTTYIPIWYIQMVLRAIGLDNTWTNGTTWNVRVAYKDYDKSHNYLESFSTMTDAKNALLQYPGGYVTNLSGTVQFTEPSFKNVDLRYYAPANVTAASLDTYLKNHDSIMTGLGQVFMDAQKTYGVNANYLVSHALEESGTGVKLSQIALQKNNLYGYGAFDSSALASAGTFPSEAYAVVFQAWEIRHNYLDPGSSNYGGSPTVTGMSKSYASDPGWADNVNNLMNQLAIDLNDNVTSYTQYSASNTKPVPPSSPAEPVFLMNGATATVQADSNYDANVPVYSDVVTADEHMFAGTLAINDSGPAVKALQQALNSTADANLTADGIYGSHTAAAVQAFQSSHGLSATGSCDFQTWNALNLTNQSGTVAAGQSIQVDQLEQGLAGTSVALWAHIPGIGWVDANDIQFSNVYRLTVPDPKNANEAVIAVKTTGGQTVNLHVGDEIEATPANAGISHPVIQFVDQTTGQKMTGTITTPNVTLTKTQ